MAKVFTSTLAVKCEKEHTCAACGAVYSYVLMRRAVGQGGSAARSQRNLQKRIDKILAQDTDMQPCPTCGIYQPDMVGRPRSRRLGRVALFALLPMAAIPILRATDVLQANTLTWIAVVVALCTAVAYLLVGAGNPNSDLMANTNLARERVAAGAIRHQAGSRNTNPEEYARPQHFGFHMAGLLLLALAVLLAAGPELLRAVRGWPLNAAAYPPVVGPGDHTRIYLSQPITSVKGYWRGSPVVTLTDPHDAAAEPLDVIATTDQRDWGSYIDDVKTNEEHENSYPWVELTLPNKGSLANKPVACAIALDVEFPAISVPGQFQNNSTSLRQTVNLNLASAGAGNAYNTLWWTGAIGALVLDFLAGAYLLMEVNTYIREAKPTRILQLPPPPPAVPVAPPVA